MCPEELDKIIKRGEGIDVEFKKSQFELNNDVFETICAFLNQNGGTLLLGVCNDGTIEGVCSDSVQKIINNLISNSNNPNKLEPPFNLTANRINYKGDIVIHVYIPESSQVHKTNTRIFIRNEDGDFDITTRANELTQLYLRKQNTFTENEIYPYVKTSDLKSDLLKKVRILSKNINANHPWQYLDDEDLLRSAGLYRHDRRTGRQGYTLAAVLLFGNDEVIQDVIPYYKTDAQLRVIDTNNYDDRLLIRTNLIDSYSLLLEFVKKHIKNPWYIENTQRISARDKIFREIICNLLIHREYSNPHTAILIIESDKVFTENWNRPYFYGEIDPANFTPHPKNPTIAKIFNEIGWAEELGSGVRNTFKYCKIIAKDNKPKFIDHDIFKVIVPLFYQEIPLFEVSEVSPLYLDSEDECADFEFVLTVTSDLLLPSRSQALPPYLIEYKVDCGIANVVQILASDETVPGSGFYTKTLDFCYDECGTYEFVFAFLESNGNQRGGTIIERQVKIHPKLNTNSD